MHHIVFRDLPSLLQIRHNAPRNAPLRRELALLDMNEVSSRTLSGHLRAPASAGRTGGPGNFNPPVARGCTVKHTHYSTLKLGAAPFVMSVALVSSPAYAQDATFEGLGHAQERYWMGTSGS